VDEIYKRKLVEFADLNPDEINEIMEYEEQKREMMTSQLGMGVIPVQPMQPVNQPQPTL
jgi:hypothetical protein